MRTGYPASGGKRSEPSRIVAPSAEILNSIADFFLGFMIRCRGFCGQQDFNSMFQLSLCFPRYSATSGKAKDFSSKIDFHL